MPGTGSKNSDDIKLGIIGIARGCRQRGSSRRELHQLRYRSYEGACEGHLRKAGGAAAGAALFKVMAELGIDRPQPLAMVWM